MLNPFYSFNNVNKHNDFWNFQLNFKTIFENLYDFLCLLRKVGLKTEKLGAVVEHSPQ